VTDTLFGLHYSPWTERVRLALRLLDRPHRFVEHIPMVTEPYLRVLARRPLGRVTVPAWIPDHGPAVFDSLAIARVVDRDRVLFPEGEAATIDGWDEISQAACRALRARVVGRMAESPDAQAEALPGFVPDGLRPALKGVTHSALLFFRAKYGARDRDEAPVVRALDALRAGLVGGRRFLIGDRVSYADLAMATILQGVAPVDARWIPLTPAIREVWTNPDLADRYRDLVEWRDQLYPQLQGANGGPGSGV
jgi:glutathione S-transferase